MTYKWPNVGRDAAQYYTVRPVVVLLVLQPTHLVRSLSSTRTSVHMVDGDASLGHVVSDDGRRETPKPRIMLLYTGKSYTLFNVVVSGWALVGPHPSLDLNEL
jgi:hypothetical protein